MGECSICERDARSGHDEDCPYNNTDPIPRARNQPLNESELIELLSAIGETSKTIRFSDSKVSSPAVKNMQYEQMLRLVEMFETHPDIVRDNLRIAKTQQETYNKMVDNICAHLAAKKVKR